MHPSVAPPAHSLVPAAAAAAGAVRSVGMAAPQEFVIRASGADKAATKHLVARFPLAFRPDPRSDETANAPELKGTGDWTMGQMEQGEARPGTRGWVGWCGVVWGGCDAAQCCCVAKLLGSCCCCVLGGLVRRAAVCSRLPVFALLQRCWNLLGAPVGAAPYS